MVTYEDLCMDVKEIGERHNIEYEVFPMRDYSYKHGITVMTYEEDLENIVSLCESAKKAKNDFNKADGYLRAIEVFVSSARKKLKKEKF